MFEPQKPETDIGATVPVRLAQQAKSHPEEIAIVCGDQRITWGTFYKRVKKVANGLKALGLTKGDKVCILASASPAYLEVFFGTLAAGCCLVPLSTMASSEALERMINDSSAKVFFLSKSMGYLADPFSGQLSGLVAGGRIALDYKQDQWQDYETWISDASQEEPNVDISYEDHFNIIYSSGTTGVPKGILHNHLLRGAQIQRGGDLGYNQEAVTMLSTPLYSNTTIVSLLPALAGGGRVVLMPKFNAHEFVSLVAKERATHAMLVPVQYKRIMDLEDFDSFDLSSMKQKFSTSAPLRSELKADVLKRFPGGLTEYYGLTEGGCTTVLNCHEYPDKLASVGVPVPGGELKFIDEQGDEVAQGVAGEICGRSSMMMSGYFNRDDLTQEMLWEDKDGKIYFRTGDMGYMDEDGFVFLSDRKKDMIISGGLNIYATDLEITLAQHPAVDDVAVIGIPSEEWGETPLGLVVLKQNVNDTEHNILTWVNEKLGKSQRLSAVEFRDKLPRSSIGKILKRELRQPYLDK
ncbi:MAG: acyl--CoA ligase [Alphaproteobacteria bacterium]|nr:acyl--CoA ligase [Alphaproteobacteria bacterium]